jgi:hypothetical protein
MIFLLTVTQQAFAKMVTVYSSSLFNFILADVKLYNYIISLFLKLTVHSTYTEKLDYFIKFISYSSSNKLCKAIGYRYVSTLLLSQLKFLRMNFL